MFKRSPTMFLAAAMAMAASSGFARADSIVDYYTKVAEDALKDVRTSPTLKRPAVSAKAVKLPRNRKQIEQMVARGRAMADRADTAESDPIASGCWSSSVAC